MNGAPAVPSCVSLVVPPARVVVPATGTGLPNFSLTAVYEPQCGGAYFLGELSKFVHVSPQRYVRKLPELEPALCVLTAAQDCTAGSAV